MPVHVHLSKKELEDLIAETKANGNDTGLLEQLLAEVTPKPAIKKAQRVSMMEPEKVAQELVTSPEELKRLWSLACPHIRNSPFWEEFIARRVLVCTSCEKLHPGKFGEHRQPPLL